MIILQSNLKYKKKKIFWKQATPRFLCVNIIMIIIKFPSEQYDWSVPTCHLLGLGHTSNFSWDTPNLLSQVHEKSDVWLS